MTLIIGESETVVTETVPTTLLPLTTPVAESVTVVPIVDGNVNSIEPMLVFVCTSLA